MQPSPPPVDHRQRRDRFQRGSSAITDLRHEQLVAKATLIGVVVGIIALTVALVGTVIVYLLWLFSSL